MTAKTSTARVQRRRARLQPEGLRPLFVEMDAATAAVLDQWRARGFSARSVVAYLLETSDPTDAAAAAALTARAADRGNPAG